MRTFARTQLAILAAALLAVAGCGGSNSNDTNDSAEAPAGASANNQAEQPAASFDVNRLCTMLERSEIEAAFPDYRPVSEGTLTAEFRSCDWQMGDEYLQLRVLPAVQNPRDRLLSERETQEQNPEYEVADVTGVGEYAYVLRWQETTQLIFLAEETVFYLYTFFPAVDELTTLAGHVVERI
jgi:hypothetical protein